MRTNEVLTLTIILLAGLIFGGYLHVMLGLYDGEYLGTPPLPWRSTAGY